MKRRPTRWIALGVLVAAAALVAVLATRPPASALEADSPLLGKPAPTAQLDSDRTLSGKPFTLAAYRGRWVVLNFFASWCPPCRQEEADLVTWAYEHRSVTGPVLVGVTYDDQRQSAASFLRSTGAHWTAVDDPHDQVAFDFGVVGPPEDFLISPSGLVAAHHVGPVTTAQLDDLLARVGA